jgi:hypothetical protein
MINLTIGITGFVAAALLMRAFALRAMEKERLTHGRSPLELPQILR